MYFNIFLFLSISWGICIKIFLKNSVDRKYYICEVYWYNIENRIICLTYFLELIIINFK